MHLVAVDVISLTEGLRTDNSNGEGTNREIFITHATLDSNYRGIAVYDSSYVSVVGCWAASSMADNIWVSDAAGDDALLAIRSVRPPSVRPPVCLSVCVSVCIDAIHSRRSVGRYRVPYLMIIRSFSFAPPASLLCIHPLHQRGYDLQRRGRGGRRPG